MAAATDSVTHPSHQHQKHADDEQDDPDYQANMGEGEGGDEGGEEESEDDKDDSEDDHDIYLVSTFDAEYLRDIRSGRYSGAEMWYTPSRLRQTAVAAWAEGPVDRHQR
jgi:hypothetical protein